jgi:hypothetical protein
MKMRLTVFAAILLAAIALLPSTNTALAICASLLLDGNFERQNRNTVSRPWVAEGKAGIDVGKRLSAEGRNNAWARSASGWNAIRQQVQLSQGVPYILTGAIRSSGNMRDGYFGIRDAAQKPVSEVKFGPLGNYRRLEVRYTPAYSGWHNIFAGFWATGKDAWIQIDDIQLMAPCNDVILKPADN